MSDAGIDHFLPAFPATDGLWNLAPDYSAASESLVIIQPVMNSGGGLCDIRTNPGITVFLNTGGGFRNLESMPMDKMARRRTPEVAGVFGFGKPEITPYT